MKTSVLSFLGLLLSTFVASADAAPPANYEVDVEHITIDEANQLVRDLLKDAKIAAKEFFCVQNDLVCRTHYALTNPSGLPIQPFYVRFVAVDRSQASQGYFFPVAGRPGFYIRFEDFTFDGTVNINQIVRENVTKVEKTEDGRLSAIRGAILPKLGTTQYTEADIIVTNHMTVIEGVLKDYQDPDFRQQVRTEYLRTTVTERSSPAI